MNGQYRILLVEDVASDAEILLRELKRAGIGCDSRRVETAVSYRQEIEDFRPHVILSDFTMPGFDGMEALAMARRSHPEIPFIFVSGTLGEEYAVRALKSGATDYVLKTNLIRLPAAVERAIKDAEERRVRQALEHDLRESEERYRELFQNNPHPMWVYDIETLRFLAVNDTAVARYGFSREEFLAMTIKDIRPEKDVPRLLERVAQPLPIVSTPETWQHRTKNGELIDVEIASHDLVLEGRPARIVVAYNVTERTKIERENRETQKFLSSIFDNIPNMIFVKEAEELRFLRLNPAGEQLIGFSEKELIGKNDYDFFPKEQADFFVGKDRETLESRNRVFILDEKIRTKDGTEKILQTKKMPILDERGNPQYLLGISEDVTERRQAEQQLRESEAKYRQLIEQAADGIFISDTVGNFILVNSRGCELLGYTENELIGMNGTVTYLDEDREIHTKRMEQVRSGQVLRFERMVRRKDGSAFPAEISLKTLDNGMVQVIFHDITERRNQERKIARLSRIQAVLSGINSAIVRIRDREELFQEACRIAVDQGGFTVSWISVLDHTSGKLVPVAKAGLPLNLDGGGDSGPVAFTPAGTAEVALRETRPAFDNEIERGLGEIESAVGPDTLSVRQAAIEAGAKSVIVLPLFVEGKTFGILTLYAPERNFFDDDELKLLTELAGDISFALEFIAKKEKVDYLAYYDPLTGLPNRTLFSERLGQQLHTRAESTELVGVALIDVERLRMVNDTLSRQAGDELLRLIARRLESNATMTRCSNPARVVADCFGVIIRGARDANELAQLIAEEMKACFGAPFVINGQELRIVARAGVSAYPSDGSTAESLLHNAEAALIKAKQAKERFVFYAPEMTARVAEMVALESKLRNAIELDQFVLHYQPKFDMGTGKLTGVEALIRWNDPDTGLVAPARFIPILEETGMIFEVGRWALRQAVRDQQRWHGKGPPLPRVAVNVSAQQLRDRHFVQDVQLALASQEGLKAALELEITESLLMEDIERNIERLKTLRDLGVTIAIDDFGTGYSSLNYLARLPMDALKIDRSFVAGMSASPENRTIVSTIISLAHSLGLKVVAEGVETDEQLKILRLLKCDEMQGFLLSRPVPPDEIASFLTLKKKRAKRT